MSPLTKSCTCVARCNCALDYTYFYVTIRHIYVFLRKIKQKSKCRKEIGATTLKEVFDYGYPPILMFFEKINEMGDFFLNFF